MNKAMFIRAVILLSCLWGVGSTIWAISKISDVAHDSGKYWEELCEKGEVKDVIGKDCNQLYKDKVSERWGEEWLLIPMVTFGPIAFLLSVLLVSYLTVRAFYWIKTGSIKVPPNARLFRNSLIGFGIILALFALRFTTVAIHSNKVEKLMAHCKYDAVQNAAGETYEDNFKRFIRACMEREGYHINPIFSSCYSYPDNAICWE